MSGPWERYAEPADGPWTKYASAPAPDYSPAGSTLENVAAGAGKAVADAYRGARKLLHRYDPENLATVQGEIDEAAKRDKPLMDTTAGKVGNVAGNVAIGVPTAFVPGANTYTGAALTGAVLGAVQPTAADESILKNAAVGAVGGAAGKVIGDKVAAGAQALLTSKQAAGAVQASQNSARDATLAAGKAEGYVVPPSQANPSAWNRLLEGLSGKIQTAQHASAKNQEVTNRLAKEALGLPVDQPITPQALKSIRDQAGQAYQAIAGGNYVADATFKNRLGALAQNQAQLAAQAPSMANKELLAIAKDLDKPTFDGEVLVELVKGLRDKADVAFRAGDKGAARFYKDASREMEDLVERNLLYTGSGGTQALQDFQNARTLIAKSYTVENALNGSNVNAAKLAADLKRGKPLTGELRTAGEFAQNFPKATQETAKMGSLLPNSPLDWALATGTSAVTGDPTGMALLVARPAARKMLLSDLYQGRMTTPSYGPGAATKTIGALLGNQYVRRAAPAASAAVAEAAQ